MAHSVDLWKLEAREDPKIPGGVRDATWVVLTGTLEELRAGVQCGALDPNEVDCVGLCPVIAAVLQRDVRKVEYLEALPGFKADVAYKGRTLEEWKAFVKLSRFLHDVSPHT